MAQNNDLQQMIEAIQERYAPDRRVEPPADKRMRIFFLIQTKTR
jgi:hypothetical protein